MSPPCSEAWAGFAVVPSQGKRVCVISLAKKTTNRKVLWPWRSTLAFWTPKCDYIETTPLPTSSAVFQVRMPAAGDRVGDCVDFTHVWLQRGHGLANAYCFLSERNEKGHSKALELQMEKLRLAVFTLFHFHLDPGAQFSSGECFIGH